MKTLNIFFLISFMSFQISIAQEADSTENHQTYNNIGIGVGMTYGGIGGHIVINLTETIGLFGALGYNLESLGFNVGPMLNFPSKSKTQFYLTAMYGYNGVIVVSGANEYNKTYYGVTAGIGLKLKSSRNTGNYWDFGLLVPFRSSSFRDDWDDIKNNSAIEVQSEPWPINICVGYNFRL